MASQQEDLEFNPFYQILLTRYSNQFAYATKKCYMICIPEASSLVDVTIDDSFVENHVLRPSPFFQGQYLTTDLGNSKVVHLEDRVIKTGSGFKDAQTVAIVQEELSYNKDLKPYKVLVIKTPIGLKISEKLSNGKTTKKQSNDYTNISYKENEEFLLSLDGHKEVLTSLDDAIQKFNTNYMILEDYLGDTSAKLKSIFEYHSQYMSRVINHPMKNDSRFRDSVDIAVESYIVHAVHPKLIPVIRRKFSTEDKEVCKKCASLKHLTSDNLGVQSKFSCELPLAVKELKNMDTFTTSLEKMSCIKSTLDMITAGVDAHTQNDSIPSLRKEAPQLTSDDLIPLMAYVIIQAQCNHYITTEFYIKNFQWAAVQSGDISYSFVTYQAALEFLRNTNFKKLITSKQEVSHKSSSQSMDKQPEPAVEEIPSGSDITTRYDRQLDRITKMLEMTTQEFADVSKTVPTRPSRTVSHGSSRQGSNSALGDFLGSLQNDALPSRYGKLT